MTLNGNQGFKTPSDVFNYKLKAPMGNMKLDIQTKNSSTTSSVHNGVMIPAINSQRSKKSSKTNLTTKNSNESIRPPKCNQQQKQENINRCRIQMQKSESQKLIKKPQENQLKETFLDEIDNVNLKFIYQTTNDQAYQTQTFAPPPNSEQIVSPELQNMKIVLKEGQPQVEILDFDLDNLKDQKQQIRVMARFRPLNKVESEFKDYYSKQQDIIQFSEDSKAVKVNESYSSQSNLTFTFDYCFKPGSSQDQVFKMVGKETIDDIMEGYNGTIFAYGQTGSGKTYTMYGQDIFDEELMGIVPRAARQIFQNIKSQDLEIEYQIRVQMVEIYKEQLRDLLHDSPDTPPELKIKEDPKRGTYVEGLNEVCIVSEEEIMSVLCTGETMRHVASTNLNQLSSRSHSICIIEIVQKFPNDSEKRGVLNLVDLAGSERVSKSHAQGQALEEAKKINFSLSMLGKVINCLTKAASYIPYRDSKLTRLLKESLGGNNKTSLIVACSMHQSNLEETISSLRFAQSAKFIENKVKMNIKTSPEHLQVIIEQLKSELRSCKEEIYRLRITATCSYHQTSQKQIINEAKADEDLEELGNPFIFYKNQAQDTGLVEDQNNKDDEFKDSMKRLDFKHTIHNRPHQSLLAKNYDVIETNNQRMQMLSLLSEFSSIPGTGTPNFISPVKNYELKLMQVIHRNEDLEMKLKSKDKDLEAMRSQKDELQDKVNHMEGKVLSYQQKMLILEKRIAEFENDKDFMIVNEAKQNHKLEDYQSYIEILNQQVKCLEKALEDSEFQCQNLLKEKSTFYQKQIKDFLNDTIKLKRIKVSDALDAFINKPQQLKKSFMSQLDLLNNYTQQERMVLDAENMIQPLNEKDLLSRNIYSMEIINALEDTPPELTIYLLKQMLIEASLANHNLQRTLAVNRWRQVLEFGKHKIKSNLCKVQEHTIETLEQVLEKTRKTHDKLRTRVDKLETHLFDNKNQYHDLVIMTDGNLQTQVPNTMRNVNILKERTNQIHPNQSIVSVALNTMTQPANQKSRFVRTITNKTLGKVFNFMEKSPLSRSSVGPNQSILSHYYGQKHNPNYKMGETPNRTGGMNSPVIYNFQSPVRRQNTFIYAHKPQQPQIVSNGANGGSEGFQTMPNKVLYEGQISNDQMTFEDAIVKFFNSSEIEDKTAPRTTKNMIPLTEKKKDLQFSNEDLLKIESCETLQEVKEYIRHKFEQQSLQHPDHLQSSASVHHNPMLMLYQNNAQFSSNNHLITSQMENNPQINSHTTNNNLYAQSNDFIDGQGVSSQKGGMPCSSSGHFHDNQRQEHVLTLASEYMITSNSVIGLNGILSGNGNLMGNHFYQNDYLDRLQEKIVQLQEEVETQKCRAEEHKKAYYESKRQIEQMRELLEDKESKHNAILKCEIFQWEHALNKFKEMSENELLKKQKEIQKLHEILAQWMENYQELEQNKGVKQNGIDKLTIQTLKHQRNQSGLLCEIMKTPYYKRQIKGLTFRLSSNFGSLQSYDNRAKNNQQLTTNVPRIVTDQTFTGHLFQTHTSQGTVYGATYLKNGGQKGTERKRLNGDNSPVPQEDSCFDIDNSVNQNILLTNNEESRIEAMTLHTYQSNE